MRGDFWIVLGVGFLAGGALTLLAMTIAMSFTCP